MVHARSADRWDAVYTWVDGADPDHAAARARYADASPRGADWQRVATGVHRFRDNDDLRYSLRSLERFAPWIDRIYLVTPARPPSWLDVDHARLVVVRDDALLGANAPTFNSNAIEMNLHRIEGLSKRFLYLNDDFLLCRETPKEEFVDSTGALRLHFSEVFLPEDGSERVGLEDGTEVALTGAYDRIELARWIEMLKNTSRFVATNYGPMRLRVPLHAPYVMDRDILEELHRRWPDIAAATSAHRFRSAADHVVHFWLKAFVMAEQGPDGPRIPHGIVVCPLLVEQASIYLGWPAKRVRWMLEAVTSHRTRFMCFEDAPDAHADARALRREFLERMFPTPSSFERASSAPGDAERAGP